MKGFTIIGAIAGILALGGVVLIALNGNLNVGATQTSTTQSIYRAAGFQVSTTTAITGVLSGTGVAATTELPLEATSTDQFTIAVSKLTAAYHCDVTLVNFDSVGGGFVVNGVTAGVGTLTFGLLNQAGAATSSFANATSSAAYYCTKP